MNIVDKNRQFRFETLDKDNDSNNQSNESSIDDEMTGGISLLENKNSIGSQTGGSNRKEPESNEYSDLVIPYSVSYQKPSMKLIKRERSTSPTVIGGGLFDDLFFRLGSQEESLKNDGKK
jgi:hypothetical protein